jgi:hypothetical protein
MALQDVVQPIDVVEPLPGSAMNDLGEVEEKALRVPATAGASDNACRASPIRPPPWPRDARRAWNPRAQRISADG